MKTGFPPLKVLSSDQIDQFIRDGYTLLRGAFSPETAAAVRERLWTELGLSPDNPSGWTQNMVHIRKVFFEKPFTDAFTPRLFGALDDIMGEGRWVPPTGLGWWPVAFPGFEKPPWAPPVSGWHVDGIQFHHHLTSRDQGLLPIFFLSDIGPGDGGTAISLGSHLPNARILAESEPAGLAINELTPKVVKVPRDRVLEATGNAGDIGLLHPFMLHSRSPNTGSKVRFICNPCIGLKEAMILDRPCEEDHSPVERAIRLALHAPV